MRVAIDHGVRVKEKAPLGFGLMEMIQEMQDGYKKDLNFIKESFNFYKKRKTLTDETIRRICSCNF